MRVLSITLLLAAVLSVAVAPAASAQAASVTAQQDGWWNRTKGGNPALTSPGLPFSVPADAIAVAASNGQEDKVAAVGIFLDVPPEATFERLLLLLKESAAGGANANATGAVITACPITAQFTGVKNGEYPARPKADCDLGKAEGLRASDGTWQFDLTSIARLWLAGTVQQYGVSLQENVNSPTSFQVAWGDRTTSNLSFVLEATEPEDPGFDPEPESATESVGSDGQEFTTSLGDVSGTVTPLPVAGPGVSGGASTPEVQLAVPAARQARVGARAGKIGGNLSLATLLLLPLLAGFALVTSYVLGPAGDPVATLHRQGGVSRAMSRKRSSPEAK